MNLIIDSSVLEVFLPEKALEWFAVVKAEKNQENICIILEEKNIPPVPAEHTDKKILSKGFYDITITDFPIRCRRALLTFKRRRWQIEGEKELLKRDIKFAFPGTQLEKEFADFLKADGGRQSGLTSFYRQVSLSPAERV